MPTRSPAKYATLVLASLAMATPLALMNPASVASATAAEQTVSRINVTGEGRINLAPDIATLDMGVVSEAETAQQALEDNNIKMASVIASMKEAGIEAKDLQTSNFNIQPRYVYDQPKQGEEQKPPRIVGYTVTNSLSVIVRDLANLGEILDRSIGLGVNSGGNISFGNDDPKEAISKARAKAVSDARARAETLVGAAGASLGKILEINETTFRPMPMAKGRMMADAAMVESVPVESGENTYSVSVTISWEIIQ